MRHFNPVDGYSISASQYQAYLERMRASYPEENAARIRRKKPEAGRDDYIDPEAGSESEAEDQESPEEQKEGGEPKEGFGSHYA